MGVTIELGRKKLGERILVTEEQRREALVRMLRSLGIRVGEVETSGKQSLDKNEVLEEHK